jgi:low affinity Fe/Cu permease
MSFSKVFTDFSAAVAKASGRPITFALAVGVIVLWALCGPLYGYSDTWQLVINTGTTIVTFLMVFLIQRSQNKESMAVQLKLNELVAAFQGASNRLIDVEDLSEAELKLLHDHYRRLVEMSKKEEDFGKSHSVEEAEQRHTFKQRARRKPGQTTA